MKALYPNILLTFLIISFFTYPLYGQSNLPKIKEERVYLKDKLVNYSQFDTTGKVIYSLSPINYHYPEFAEDPRRHISAYHSIDNFKYSINIATYFNPGFISCSLTEYKNDSIEYRYQLKSQKLDRDEVNHLFNNAVNHQKFFNDTIILKYIKDTTDKVLEEIYNYNTRQKKANEIRLYDNLDTFSIETNEYNKDGQLIVSYYKSKYQTSTAKYEYTSFGKKKSYTYAFTRYRREEVYSATKNNFVEKLLWQKDENSKSNQSDTSGLCLNHRYVGESSVWKDTYKYDEHTNLISSKRTVDGKLESKSHYFYDDNNVLIRREYKKINEFKKIYEYENGHLVNDTRVSLRYKNAEPRVIWLEYEFY